MVLPVLIMASSLWVSALYRYRKASVKKSEGFMRDRQVLFISDT